ncbi:MAG: hypothetical protein HUU56_17195 [Bdellovibrionaceae bacterium]|nr:hypothetical protein [Pseudobdellovibrionaceae bacterium]
MKTIAIIDYTLDTNLFQQLLKSYSSILSSRNDLKLVLFTDKDRLEKNSEFRKLFYRIFEIENFRQNAILEKSVIDYHHIEKIDFLFVPREFDIIRGARLREKLNIQGLTSFQAEAFRDKLVMKDLCRKANIPLIPYMPINDAVDLINAKEQFKLPMVLKPRTGAGEIGLTILRTEEEYLNFLTQIYKNNFYDRSLGLLAEKYSSLKMWHLDGIVINGEIKFFLASEYVGPYPQNIPPWTQYGISGSFMHEPESQLSLEAKDFLKKVFRALPTPKNTTFHVEVWYDENNGFLLNEAAARTGGFLVHQMFALSLGILPDAIWLAAEIGIEIPLVYQGCTRSIRIPWQQGTVKKICTSIEAEGVHGFKPMVKEGQVLGAWESWSQCLATAVLLGKNNSELDVIQKNLLKEFKEKTNIS